MTVQEAINIIERNYHLLSMKVFVLALIAQVFRMNATTVFAEDIIKKICEHKNKEAEK